MIRHLRAVAFLASIVMAWGTVAQAQQRPQVPLKLQIVISRYQGDKKVSSVPYTLSVNAGGGQRSSIRMGTDVPVGTTTSTNKEGVTTSQVQFQRIGTNIDCTAQILDDGRFALSINIEDTSVFPAGPASAVPAPGASFRHFGTSENVILKDAQSSEFTVATDKSTGDIFKADVTLTVVK